MTTVKQIKAALRDAGITGLKVTQFDAGVVVNDGTCLWTCRPADLLRGAGSLVEDGTAERIRRLDSDDEGALYTALCSRAGYLARGNDADRSLHEKIVAEWHEANPGYAGDWS